MLVKDMQNFSPYFSPKEKNDRKKVKSNEKQEFHFLT